MCGETERRERESLSLGHVHRVPALSAMLDSPPCPFSGTNSWSVRQTNGKTPAARDGHSACVIRDAMFVFGGYEAKVRVTSGPGHVFPGHVLPVSHVSGWVSRG